MHSVACRQRARYTSFQLKDGDFLIDKYKLYIPSDVKAQLLNILRNDTEFLAKVRQNNDASLC